MAHRKATCLRHPSTERLKDVQKLSLPWQAGIFSVPEQHLKHVQSCQALYTSVHAYDCLWQARLTKRPCGLSTLCISRTAASLANQ